MGNHLEFGCHRDEGVNQKITTSFQLVECTCRDNCNPDLQWDMGIIGDGVVKANIRRQN